MAKDFDWKATLKAVAPAIGGVIAGGLTGNPAIGLAVRAASEALLGRADGSQDDVAAAIVGASPDQLLALKQADNQFEIDLQRVGIDLEKIAQEDRASAREREVKVGGKANPVLAGIIIGGFFSVVAWVLFRPDIMSGPGAAVAGTLVGYVSAKAEQVVAYYFGSSSGSARKTELLSKR